MDTQNIDSVMDTLDSHPAANQGEEANPDAPSVTDEQKKQVTDEQVEAALLSLVESYDRESAPVRNQYMRKWLQAEEFWKGNQHIIWKENRWQTPFEYAIEQDKADLPRYQYVTNIYQSYGLSIIAAISQRLPKVRFSPKSAKSERDIATARAASDVAELVEDNNELDMMAVREAYLMWTQGFYAAYVRYRLDKQYGIQQVPVLQQKTVKVSDDEYVCPQCAQAIPAADIEDGGLVPQGAFGTPCPNCGTQMTEHPAEYADGVVVSGFREFPNGQERIDIYGAMNVKVLPSAQKQADTPYIGLEEELHLAALKAAYPAKAAGLTGGASGTGEDSKERNQRLSLTDGTQNSRSSGAGHGSKMATYKRWWLRNWALWDCDDEAVRDELLKRFPDGVYVAIASKKVLEFRAEDPDEHWELCMPMPGQGAYRESIGGSTIPLNQRLNDAHNVAAEHVEFGSAPPVFVDGRYVNMEALRNRRMQPASFFPIALTNANPGLKLADLMHQADMKVDANIYSYGKDLIELAQVTSGAMPSIFGGNLQDVKTASGYAMAREQSLGKLNLFWRSAKQFHARLMLKAVECYRKNRTTDYELVVEEKSGDYASKYIHLEDLKGNITAHPEADEDFPATWAEIRANLMQLIQAAPEQMQQILQHPANAPMIRKFLANPDIIFPTEDAREKQYREIDQLLGSGPVPDAMGQLQPTVMPDVLIDNHDVHILTLQEFCEGDKGIEVKKTNPQGYANLMAHVMAHLEAKGKQQQIVAATQAPPPGMEPPPGAQTAKGDPTPKGGAGSTTVGDAIQQAAPQLADAAKKVLSAPTPAGAGA